MRDLIINNFDRYLSRHRDQLSTKNFTRKIEDLFGKGYYTVSCTFETPHFELIWSENVVDGEFEELVVKSGETFFRLPDGVDKDVWVTLQVFLAGLEDEGLKHWGEVGANKFLELLSK